jgi:hypothetical protein
MARILFNGEWFEEVSTTALYETEFEQLVMNHSNILYPDYIAVPFRQTVSDEFGSARADFALIHSQYRDWWVVEVEMGHHSFTGHVLPQVTILANAQYGVEQAQALCTQNPQLEVSRISDMLKGQQPRVLVVVNIPRPDWKEPLARQDALLAVFEIFRSVRNQYIFRVNGEHPPRKVDAISKCHFDKILPRLLVVESPGVLGVATGSRVTINYQNGTTEWSRLDVKDSVWLTPINNNPLNVNKVYQLQRLSDSTFLITEQDS